MLGPQDKVGNINNIYFSNHCDNSSNSVSEVYEYISDIYKDLNLSGVTLWTYHLFFEKYNQKSNKK